MENLKISNFIVEFKLGEKLNDVVTHTTQGQEKKEYFLKRILNEGVSTSLLSDMYSTFNRLNLDAGIGAFTLQLESLIDANIDQYKISFLCENLYNRMYKEPMLQPHVSNLMSCYELDGDGIREAFFAGKFNGLINHPIVSELMQKHTTITDRQLNESKNQNKPTVLPVLSYVQESAQVKGDYLFAIFGKVFAMNENKGIREANQNEYDIVFFNNANNLNRIPYAFNESEQSFNFVGNDGTKITVNQEGVHVNERHVNDEDKKAFLYERSTYQGINYTDRIMEAEFLESIFDNVRILDNVYVNNTNFGSNCALVSLDENSNSYIISFSNGRLDTKIYESVKEVCLEFEKVSGLNLQDRYKKEIFKEQKDSELLAANEAIERKAYEESLLKMEAIREKFDTETEPTRKKALLEGYQILSENVNDYKRKHNIK